MLMLWVTKVFNPGAPRIGRLTRNLVLPRTVALPDLVGAAVGGIGGMVAGLMLGPMLGMDPITSAGLGLGVGGLLVVTLVKAQPWQGEHVHRVAAVRAMAFASAKTLMCPGSGLPATYSDSLATLVCGECGLAHSSADKITPRHEWRRRVYLGIMPIPPPMTGEIVVVPGSALAAHRRWRPTAIPKPDPTPPRPSPPPNRQRQQPAAPVGTAAPPWATPAPLQHS